MRSPLLVHVLAKVYVTVARVLGLPVVFRHRGRWLHANAEKATAYHIAHSVAKLQRMVDRLPDDTQVVIDGGGNCGWFSAMVLDRFPEATLLCVEPIEELKPFIEKNCGQKVNIVPRALGASSGEITLYVNTQSRQASSVIQDAANQGGGDRGVLEARRVPVCTVGDLMAEYELGSVDVLKLDLQGYEHAALQGAEARLADIGCILIEATWVEMENVKWLMHTAPEHGFHHLGVINSVSYGVDAMLSRQALEAELYIAAYDLRDLHA